MSGSRPLQLGMFGAPPVLEDHHIVAAHGRLMPSGTMAFVPEHMRKNRPRRAGPGGSSVRRAAPPPAPDTHPSLFDAPLLPAPPTEGEHDDAR